MSINCSACGVVDKASSGTFYGTTRKRLGLAIERLPRLWFIWGVFSGLTQTVHLIHSRGPPRTPTGPVKGLYRVDEDISLIVHIKCLDIKYCFWAILQRGGGFRELREACRNHFHLSWYL